MPCSSTFTSSCRLVVMMRLPPGLPVSRKGRPSRSTMIGVMELTGLRPAAIWLSALPISPKASGMSGRRVKLPRLLFMRMPVPSITTPEP